MTRDEARGSAAGRGAPPTNETRDLRLVDRLASVRLTLWLLAILALASAVATIVPQNARDEVYERAFGTLFGPLITQTTLRNVYGAWWFILAFAVLTAVLAACCVRRLTRMLTQSRRPQGKVRREGISARQNHTRLRLRAGVDDAARAVRQVLGKRRYSIREAAGEREDQRALTGGKGRMASWASVLTHLGMVAVLVGAGYGRLPSNSYREVANLAPGESFAVETAGVAFSVRLLEAGQERDEEGRPERFWARAELVEDGEVIRDHVIEPNHPLRHHWINATLQSLPQSSYLVEVSHGRTQEYVPVALEPHGGVNMMETVRKIEDPPWVVFVHDFRYHDESGAVRPAAKVFADRSGQLTHDWEPIGWVDASGVEHDGVSFRLVPGPQGAQLALDRDVGVPIVWFGFCVLSLGSLLLVTTTTGRRTCVVLIEPRGDGSQVFIGLSGPGANRDIESVSSQVRAELDGESESGNTGEGEGRA
jgi:cytochrome c biogenesis protein